MHDESSPEPGGEIDGPPDTPEGHPATPVADGYGPGLPTPHGYGPGWYPGMAFPGPVSSQQPERRRRWPWLLTIGLLVIALGATASVAMQTHRSAKEWRSEALDAQRRASRLERRLGDAEEDAEELTARIDELAAEKAAIADERELKQQERDTFAALSLLAADVTIQLQECLGMQSHLFGVLLDAGPYSDWDWILDIAEETDSTCDDAQDAASQLETAVMSAP